MLEDPLILPGEPPSAGVLPAHTPHGRSLHTEKLQPWKAGVHVHIGQGGDAVSEGVVVAPLGPFLDIGWSFESTVWMYSVKFVHIEKVCESQESVTSVRVCELGVYLGQNLTLNPAEHFFAMS